MSGLAESMAFTQWIIARYGEGYLSKIKTQDLMLGEGGGYDWANSPEYREYLSEGGTGGADVWATSATTQTAPKTTTTMPNPENPSNNFTSEQYNGFTAYQKVGGKKYASVDSWVAGGQPKDDTNATNEPNTSKFKGKLNLTVSDNDLYYDEEVNGHLYRYFYALNANGTWSLSDTQDMGPYGGGGSTTDTDYLDSEKEQLAWDKQKWKDQQEADKQQRLLQWSQQPSDWIQYYNAAYGKNPDAPVWLQNYLGVDSSWGQNSTSVDQVPAEPRAEDYQLGGKYVLSANSLNSNRQYWKDYQDWVANGSPDVKLITTTTGNGITPMDVATPSGQWLNRTNPTIQGGLKGYANWSAGQNKSRTWDDLLNQANQMLPTEKAYSRNSWKAMKQKGW